MLPGSQPLVGRQATVQVDAYAFMPVPGQYVETEGDRFGDKISVGNLGYQDFNPFENAEAAGPFDAGYGLVRYSDYPDSNTAHRFLQEASDADAANGYVILSGQQTLETLPGNSDPVLWIGELITSGAAEVLLAVAGQRVYSRTVGGTWIDTGLALAATPRRGAIGVFGRNLIIGYGADANAQYTTDLATLSDLTVDGTGVGIRVYAMTADHAQAYVGGNIPGDSPNTVYSSLDGIDYESASATAVGQPNDLITGLAPGGGLATVYVATTSSMGQITTGSPPLYNALVPFDSRQSTNGEGLGWLMARGGDDQRGPLSLHFVRDGDPWMYSPSSQTGGEAQNIAPWAQPYQRPTVGFGTPTVFYGTARYLYYAIQNTVADRVFVVRHDNKTGATLHYWDFEDQPCYAITASDLIDGVLRLYAGRGADVCSTRLPATGDNPLQDPDCTYQTSAIIDLPRMNMGFPDEPDVHFAVRLDCANLAPGVRSVRVSCALDDATTYTQLGIADSDNVTEILFDAPPQSYSIRFRLTLTNTDPTQTLVLYALTSRKSINPTLYRQWQFLAPLPAGELQFAHDLQDPYTVQQALWRIRAAGVPIAFTDVWGDSYLARLMKLRFTLAQIEEHRPPQWQVEMLLLQASGRAVTYAVTTWANTSASSSWPLPIVLPTVYLGPSSIVQTAVPVNNGADHTVYPQWVVAGAASQLVFTNTTTGSTWTWTGTLGSGDSLTINFNPTKQLVTDSSGADQSGGVALGSTWWGLVSGANSLDLAVYGANATTQLTLRVPSA